MGTKGDMRGWQVGERDVTILKDKIGDQLSSIRLIDF